MSLHDDDDEIIAAAREGFLQEAHEMLRQFEEGLLGLEQDPQDAEQLNSVFRAAHTIKGTAGLFGCDRVVAFTHDVETLLEAMRAGEVAVTEAAMSVLLKSRDQIEALLGDVTAEVGDPQVQAASSELIASLRTLRGAQVPQAAEPGGVTQTESAPEARWHIWIRFGVDALRNGLDPLSFLRYMNTQGNVLSVRPLLDRVCELQALDPEDCHLGFEAIYEQSATEEAVAGIFEFVREDSELRIESVSSSELVALTDDALKQVAGETLAPGQATLVHAEPVDDVLENTALANRRSGADRRKTIRDRRSEEAKFVRVQADKLDRLIDLVGELVIASSGAQLVAQEEGSATFAEAALRVRTLVESARDGALALRMVPIGETFARFHRVVRDISKAQGKEVELQITGADTELDKSMVEVIADPLMHLVRNSLDHGLESTGERQQVGKPTRGVIALHAYHEGGQVVIEVTDDGRGLDRDRILRKAIDRGLIAADANPSDMEVHQLICMPGFSTKDEITDLSGRGVGMDVVKRSIEQLRGQMQIASSKGQGTTTQIRLPLTLAIIDGFLTSVGGTYYVLPMEIVAECIDMPMECVQEPRTGVGYFNLRGEVLPFFDVSLLHQVPSGLGSRRSLVVAREGHTRIGLIVDKLHGEYQTVIKPLSSLFRHLRAIAGSTILGSGDVALVLDVPALVKLVSAQAHPSKAAESAINRISPSG